MVSRVRRIYLDLLLSLRVWERRGNTSSLYSNLAYLYGAYLSCPDAVSALISLRASMSFILNRTVYRVLG